MELFVRNYIDKLLIAVLIKYREKDLKNTKSQWEMKIRIWMKKTLLYDN